MSASSKSPIRKLVGASLLAVPVAFPAFAEVPSTIGTTAIVQNDVRGTIGAKKRKLGRGDGVFQNEQIRTGRNSGAQFMFRDETTLTLNENSSIVLDKLIYDPGKKQGALVLRALSGSFRFISGSQPKKNYKIKTPVGTIGIRGTIIGVTIIPQKLPNGKTLNWVKLAVFEGGATLCNLTQACTNLPAGTFIVVQARSQLGSPSRNSGGKCSSSGSFSGSGGRQYCTIFSETGTPLNIRQLSTTASFNIPAVVPPTPEEPPTPPTGGPPPSPPPGPPPTDGFSPILTPQGNLPPGLDRPNLPPGLVNNRDPQTRLPPGLQNNGKIPPGLNKGQ